ncbi:hypothetical protein Mycsm_00784 [Mycobacterium sp. JS623]|uniref:hypothetical protein n=1 Tax=Mycobacterium sp. JS623 TaxID=212767 RepID=UPI0002A55D2D|nr:hypothetical protein [Mycobacterium sp. JS623]AGB21224.1 hypothetical protein Mycsm_00784 [Mycobacterium sp. JS623]
MLVNLTKMSPVLLAGAAAAAISLAPAAFASPMSFPAGGPPGCYDLTGTGCAAPPPPAPVAPGGVAGPEGAAGAVPGGPGGVAGPEGAAGAIPGGPSGAAGPQGAAGTIPGGPSGVAGPGGASGCIPGVGCGSVPGQ